MLPTSILSLLLLTLPPDSISAELEAKTFGCLASVWVYEDSSLTVMKEGAQLFDQYLKSKGYLGSGTVAEYLRFSMSGRSISIPENTPGYEKMRRTILGDSYGAPDAGGIMGCFINNLADHKAELDSADVMFKLAVLMEDILIKGTPDVDILAQWYGSLKQDEFDRPLIKLFFYLSICFGPREDLHSVRLKFEGED